MKTFDRQGVDQGTFLDAMDSIACGVEAWFEENTDYSRRVTETAVDIARKLGIPEGEIERWSARRLIRCTEKGGAIKSLLERLQASSLAHCVEVEE
jgi:hypothetical protein